MAQFASATFNGTTDFELSAVDANFSKLDSASYPAYIVSNRLYGEGAAPPRYVHSATPPSADYEVSADIYIVSQSRNSAGVLARAVPGSLTGYWGRYRPDVGWQIQRYNAGTGTVLGSAVPESISAGTTRRIRLRVVGNVISLYRDAETTPIISVTDASPLAAAGKVGVLVSSPKTVGVHIDNFSADTLATDTTAPTLTSPSATATGTTTASGSVTTNEANGTLYYLASANASESVATVKAGSSQAVSASGVQNVTVSGLTASTSYYLHFVHTDAAANDSTVATSTQFTTSAAGDTTVPTLTGSVTFTSITQTGYTAQWPAGSDNVAVTGYEYQIGGTAGAWTGAGNNLSVAITGRTAGTTETVYVRAYDAAGNRSTPAISGNVTLLSVVAGINVTEPLKNNTGTVLASQSGVRVAVLQAADLVSVYETTGITTNASGILATISNAAIITGQQYHVAIKLADGGVGITGPITAS